jgi:hypothetical protein
MATVLDKKADPGWPGHRPVTVWPKILKQMCTAKNIFVLE